LKARSVLAARPPPRTGRSGRPRTRGARLGTPADVAALATTRNAWRTTQVRRYGRTDAVQITELACLWYGSFRSRTVRGILVRDEKPRTRGRADGFTGCRWSPPIWNLPRKIWWRVTRRGGESSRPSPTPARSWVWARPAIGHVVPWNGRCRSEICFSVVTLWYALHGHAPGDVA